MLTMALAALLEQQAQVTAFINAQERLLPPEQIGACVAQQCSMLVGMIEKSHLALADGTNLTEQLQSSGTWNGRQLQLLGTAIGKAVTGSHVVGNKSYARRPMQQVQFFHHYLSKKDVVALSSDAGHVHPNFLMLLYFLVILFLNF